MARFAVPFWPLVAAAFLSAAAVSCTAPSNGWTIVTPAPDSLGTPVHIVGVVKHVTVEGGVFTVQGDDGVTYNAMNLPEAFQQDGVAVEIEGRRRDDMMSIQMVGPMLQITRIRARAR